MNNEIKKCFLSQATSDMCLMHDLRIFDPIANEVDEVYISDLCYRVICNGSDRNVAEMWGAYKQATSSGYTDSGFIAGLKTECRRLQFSLSVILDVDSNGGHLCLMTRPISPASGNLRLWCRSRIPIPPRIVRSAEAQIEIYYSKANWNWIHGRWLIATPPDKNGNISQAAPPWDDSLFTLSQEEWGNPPDLFQYIAGDQTLPGYEIIRRMLL